MMDIARKNGAQANGLTIEEARGRYLCLHHPNLPIEGTVLTHVAGGASSPDLKSGGERSSRPHHPGSPRSQSLSFRASMIGGKR